MQSFARTPRRKTVETSHRSRRRRSVRSRVSWQVRGRAARSIGSGARRGGLHGLGRLKRTLCRSRGRLWPPFQSLIDARVGWNRHIQSRPVDVVRLRPPDRTVRPARRRDAPIFLAARQRARVGYAHTFHAGSWCRAAGTCVTNRRMRPTTQRVAASLVSRRFMLPLTLSSTRTRGVIRATYSATERASGVAKAVTARI